MKTLKTILPVALIMMSATACHKKLFPIKGKGENVTEIRSISNVDKISLSVNANVIYVQDSVSSLKLTGQANILAVLTTNVSNGELEISFRQNVRKHNQVTIEVHTPNISGFGISGSGDISASGPLNAGYLKLRISGSGNISVNSMHADNLEASISGSGNIDINSGSVQTQSYDISGSGDMNMGAFESQHTTAKISGSGSITVKVQQVLNASISGSGDIRYYGLPAVNASISGSGSVIHL